MESLTIAIDSHVHDWKSSQTSPVTRQHYSPKCKVTMIEIDDTPITDMDSPLSSSSTGNDFLSQCSLSSLYSDAFATRPSVVDDQDWLRTAHKFLDFNDTILLNVSLYMSGGECAAIKRVCRKFNETNMNVATYLRDLQHFDRDFSHCLEPLTIVVRSSMSEESCRDLSYFLINYPLLRRFGARLSHQCGETRSAALCLPIIKEVRLNNDLHSSSRAAVRVIANALEFGVASEMSVYNLSDSGLKNGDISVISKALLNRGASNNCNFTSLSKLDLSLNSSVGDSCLTELLLGVAVSAPKLKILDLTNTVITDAACVIIGRFYQKWVSIGASSVENVLWNNTKVTRRGERLFWKLAVQSSLKRKEASDETKLDLLLS